MIVFILIGLCIALGFFPTLRCVLLHSFKLIYYGPLDLWNYFQHKGWSEAKYGRIICYVANSSTSFGCGKTLSATDYLASLYCKYNDWKAPAQCFMEECQKRGIHLSSKFMEFLTDPYSVPK